MGIWVYSPCHRKIVEALALELRLDAQRAATERNEAKKRSGNGALENDGKDTG